MTTLLFGALKSKIIWTNAAALVLEVLNYLQPMLPPGGIAVTANVLSIILRFYTDKPLSEK